ncbi:MAG: PEP-CTERM sorting domain-containing protein [Phycisphaerae bacterium]
MTILGAAAQPARADFSRRIFRGVTFALSPSIGQAQNGPLADQNIFRQRFIRNYAGDGVGYEFTRLWGNDSFGNAVQLDAGPVNMALQGTTHARVTVNRRLIPEMNLSLDTGGAPLNYAVRGFTGLQNIQATGSFTGTLSGTLNVLGFYNLQATAANNNSNLRVDGVLVTDNRSTDFDVGPINVTGNIWIDAASNTLQALGNVAGSIYTNIASAATARKKTPAVAKPTDPTDTANVATDAAPEFDDEFVRSIIQALFSDALVQQLLAVLSGQAAQQVAALPPASTGSQQLSSPASNSALVPEPATLVLLGLPAFFLLRRRRA